MQLKGIAIIGRTAEGVNLTDGQTIKTKILRDELSLSFPERRMIIVDTYQYKKNACKILINLFRAFVECEDIFVLLSRNGRTFFFPLITGLNKIFHRRLYHDVVGGALPDEAKKSPFLIRQLKKFDVNWVEFEGMKKSLEALGVCNVEVLPNFKRLNPVKEDSLYKWNKDYYVYSMFSRVVKTKGIDVAIEAISSINCRYGKKLVELQIYGPVEDEYKEEFEMLLMEHQDCVRYGGCIPYDKSVEVLSDSYMLLFPSVYPGEGMPGTIIDAFSAGLPVIATDWHFNAELVKNGKTGFCYDWRRPELLEEWIEYSIRHPEEVYSMRKNCLDALDTYSPDEGLKIIRRRMEKKSRRKI